MELIKDFGGYDLLSRTSIECSGDNISIDVDEEASHIVHGAMFFCGEYRSIKCKFELLQ